jgi:hypothetical protein
MKKYEEYMLRIAHGSRREDFRSLYSVEVDGRKYVFATDTRIMVIKPAAEITKKKIAPHPVVAVDHVMRTAFEEKPTRRILLERKTLLKWCGPADWKSSYGARKPTRFGRVYDRVLNLVLLGRIVRCLDRHSPIKMDRMSDGDLFRFTTEDAIGLICPFRTDSSYQRAPKISKLEDILSPAEKISGQLWGFKNGD